MGSRRGNWEMPIVLSNLIGTRANEMNLTVRVLFTSNIRYIVLPVESFSFTTWQLGDANRSLYGSYRYTCKRNEPPAVRVLFICNIRYIVLRRKFGFMTWHTGRCQSCSLIYSIFHKIYCSKEKVWVHDVGNWEMPIVLSNPINIA